MSATVVRAEVTSQPIGAADLEAGVVAAAEGHAGAVVSFTGAVRDHDGDRGVIALHYRAHPTAGEVVADLVAGIAAQVDGVRAIAVAHRVGDLVVGDVAFAVSVAADHRAAGFATCARVVDEVKAALPVWKHQFFADGTDEWVGTA